MITFVEFNHSVYRLRTMQSVIVQDELAVDTHL